MWLTGLPAIFSFAIGSKSIRQWTYSQWQRKNNLQEGPLWHYGHPIYRVKAGLPDKDLNKMEAGVSRIKTRKTGAE